jgi:hypothetical protein
MAWFSIPAALASRGRPGIIVALGMTVMLAGCAQTGENGPQGLLKGDPSVSGDRNDRGLLAEGSGDSRRNGSGDTVYFSSDSSDLTPEAQQILQLQARWLAANAQRTITIEGHADERGTREYNLALPRQPRPCGVSGKNHFLRQGATGCGVRRHFVLVAEPARPNRA